MYGMFAGGYHLIYIYLAVKGKRGFDFSHLPLFNWSHRQYRVIPSKLTHKEITDIKVPHLLYKLPVIQANVKLILYVTCEIVHVLVCEFI